MRFFGHNLKGLLKLEPWQKKGKVFFSLVSKKKKAFISPEVSHSLNSKGHKECVDFRADQNTQ